MGQQIFIPNGGGGGGGNGVQKSTFVTEMVSTPNFVQYGLATGGDVFWNDVAFTAVVAFRVVQETPDESIPIPILVVVNNAGESSEDWQFQINGFNLLKAAVGNGGLDPEETYIPLGRVIFATITYAPGDAKLYLNGLLMAEAAPTIAGIGGPVSIRLGTGDISKDYIQYIGFGFIADTLSEISVANVFIASQDDGRIVFPAADIEAPYVIYNADTGLSNLALWVPEFNTLGAPNLPAINGGIATGTLLLAPFHVAHSGYATAVLP